MRTGSLIDELTVVADSSTTESEVAEGALPATDDASSDATEGAAPAVQNSAGPGLGGPPDRDGGIR